MARRGRPTVEINLSADERKTLQRWARRHSSSQALALRCRIVLACADGDRTRDEIAAEVGCNPATVTKWRHRFAADRLDGLVDAPRPGAARSIGDDVVEAIVVETLETAPPDATLGSANVNIEVAYLATNTRLVFAVDDLDTARSAL
jgi:transposase-like protein